MLQNESIVIKPLERHHLEHLRHLRNHPETGIYLTSIIPINEYMQEAWFKNISLDSTKIYFSIEDHKAKFIGMIRCDEWDKINQSIRVGVDIVKDARRKGFATKAYTLLLQYLFKHLSIHRVWLLVVDYNLPALSLYEKLGFTQEGKQREAIYRQGKFHDYLMMSLLKEEYDEKNSSL